MSDSLIFNILNQNDVKLIFIIASDMGQEMTASKTAQI